MPYQGQGGKGQQPTVTDDKKRGGHPRRERKALYKGIMYPVMKKRETNLANEPASSEQRSEGLHTGYKEFLVFESIKNESYGTYGWAGMIIFEGIRKDRKTK